MRSPAPRPGHHRDDDAGSDPKAVAKTTPKPLDKTYTTTIIAVVATFLFLYLIRVILLPFVLAGIVAYICTPAVEWLKRRLRLPRLLATCVVFGVLAGAAGVAFAIALPPLMREITAVAGNLAAVFALLLRHIIGTGTVTVLGQAMNADQIAATVTAGLRDFLQQNGRILLFAGEGIAALSAFFLGWVLLFYFLAGGPRIASGLFWMIPPSERPLVRRIWPVMNSVLRRYFVGVAVVVVYTSIAAYIGLGIFLGLNHAVTLAILTGLLETVPVVGPASSAIMGGLVALNHATSLANIFKFAIYLLALRISIDQMLGPLILGAAARIPPVLVIFCFLSGAILFWISGVILAVPLALSIKIVLEAVYHDPLG